MGGWWTDLWDTSLPGQSGQQAPAMGPVGGMPMDPGFMAQPGQMPGWGPQPWFAAPQSPQYPPGFVANNPWAPNWMGGGWGQPAQDPGLGGMDPMQIERLQFERAKQQQADPVQMMQRQAMMQQWAGQRAQAAQTMGGF